MLTRICNLITKGSLKTLSGTFTLYSFLVVSMTFTFPPPMQQSSFLYLNAFGYLYGHSPGKRHIEYNHIYCTILTTGIISPILLYQSGITASVDTFAILSHPFTYDGRHFQLFLSEIAFRSWAEVYNHISTHISGMRYALYGFNRSFYVTKLPIFMIPPLVFRQSHIRFSIMAGDVDVLYHLSIPGILF